MIMLELLEMAHSKLPMKKKETATRRIGLRPQMSLLIVSMKY
jgi:hypothetical protein